MSCEKPIKAKGFCLKHYMRLKRHGTTALTDPTPIERFLTKINYDGSLWQNTHCWEWLGQIHNCGYGVFSIKRNPIYEHRFSYNFFFGAIPKKMTIDHLCRNRICVNPYHLEVVTYSENIHRGAVCNPELRNK
jgi:hypothetical protein